MDPLTLSLLGISIGTSIFGSLGQGRASKRASEVSRQISANNIEANKVRQQAAHLDAKRRTIENIRNTQLAQSMSLAAAVNQGGQFSSGFAGGQAQISNRGSWNNLGIAQNLQFGDQLFALDNQNSVLKQQISDIQGQAADYQGISSIGAAIGQSADIFGRMGKSFSLGGSMTTPFKLGALY